MKQHGVTKTILALALIVPAMILTGHAADVPKLVAATPVKQATVPLLAVVPPVGTKAVAALELPFVFLTGKPAGPTAPSTVAVARTRDELLLFFHCQSAKPGTVQAAAKDGGGIWEDDYVEIFLGPQGDPAAMFAHFLVNPNGVLVADQCRADGETVPVWHPRVTVTAKIGKDGWTADVRIPFAELLTLGAPAGAQVWLANFGRVAQAENEETVWCATDRRTSFVPQKFGVLVMAAEAK